MMVAAYDWSAFYVGINGGGGSSRKCWDATNDGFGPLSAAPEGCHDATGGTVGGQVGYRWQSAAFVFGVEAQGNWADSAATITACSTPMSATARESMRLAFHRPDRCAWNNDCST